jgi:hypothetical protein
MGRVSPGIDLHIEFLRELYGETYRQVVPAIAAEMLADGVSTPALDELAGLTNGTRDSIIAHCFSEPATNCIGNASAANAIVSR